MRLQWANTAREELFRASDFLDAESMGSSVKMLEAALSAASLLVQHPQLGPAIMGSRLRKWPVADHPFLFLYEIARPGLTIVRFVHNRTNWQSLLLFPPAQSAQRRG